MGAAAKSVARLLAEKGARLIEIEYLMASQTVISSFVSPFLLRYYGIPVAILLLLWPFSPVGSQAILRIIGAKDNTVFMADASPPIPYIKPSLFVEMNFTNRGEAGLQDVIASLLGSSLYSPEAGLQNMNGTLADFDDRAARLRTQFSRFGADMWGNVRIPKLESLPGYDPSHPENWVDVQYRSQLINYASLVGVRAERFPENITGNVSWTMGASYHQFSVFEALIYSHFWVFSANTQQCQPWHVVGMGTDGIKSLRNHSFLEENYKNMFIFHNPALNNSNWTTVLDDMFQGRNIAVVIDTDKGGWDTSWKSSASREPREPEDWPWDDGSYSFPPRSVYFGFRGMSNETAFTKCEPSVSYVVVNVTSEMTNEGTTPLVVNRIKRMDNFPTSPTLHVWQHPYITWMISDCFPKLLRYYEEGYVRGVVRPPPHVRYILDPAHFREDPWIYKNTEFPEWVAANFTNGMFQDRFGLVFNTFWRAMSHDISNFDLEWMANGHPKYVATTQASYLSPAPQTYVLNMAWLAVYFVANVIVLVAAVVALYMRSICRAPDILGNVSSILRYSRHFDDSALKSAIDGTAAARVKHLGKVRVRIGDVENFALVGKIEFARDETAMAIDVRRQYK